MSSEVVETSGYSQLTENEERLYIIDAYIIGTICVVLALYYISCAIKENINNRYYASAVKCAVSSFTFSIMSWIGLSVLGNDLIIPWKGYSSNPQG